MATTGHKNMYSKNFKKNKVLTLPGPYRRFQMVSIVTAKFL